MYKCKASVLQFTAADRNRKLQQNKKLKTHKLQNNWLQYN